jgi:hypothetical protein
MAGLKTLAKELQSKGRNGDTILAHINPQEAGILKALGGSGTRNPYTGLPEFFYKKYISPSFAAINPFNPGSGLNKTINTTPIIGDINQAANKLGTQIFQPLEKAIVQPTSRGLADFDKQVAKTIPGGWSTVGQVALSAMGAPVPLQVAYGAARGGGLMRTGSSLEKTNLQGAVIGGATAYAQAKLGEYMQGAVPPGAENTTGAIATEGGTYILPGEGGDILVNSQGQLLSNSGQVLNAPTAGISSLPAGYANATPYTTPPPDLGMQHQMEGLQEGFRSAGQETVGQPSMFSRAVETIKEAPSKALDSITEGGKSAVSSVQDFGKAAIDPSTYTGAIDKGIASLDKGFTNVGDTFTGAKNLVGLGDISSSEAAKLAAKTGIDPMKMAGIVIAGESTLAGMEEQRKYLEEAKRANAISQAEYDRAMASIYSQRDYAADVVSKNQFNPNPSRDVSIGETFYGRSGEGENLYGRAPDSGSMLYAMGGSVDDELGGDYSAMGMDQGNLQKGLFGLGYAAGGMPNLALSRLSQPAFNEGAVGGMQQFAEGGTPRFLSGGGDGMSDSIKATINNNQPARLADGEFVIPADVVSHLGNGSSKAGAKQLYSMMDKIRKARTGRKSQGKQINPRKYLPA